MDHPLLDFLVINHSLSVDPFPAIPLQLLHPSTLSSKHIRSSLLLLRMVSPPRCSEVVVEIIRLLRTTSLLQFSTHSLPSIAHHELSPNHLHHTHIVGTALENYLTLLVDFHPMNRVQNRKDQDRVTFLDHQSKLQHLPSTPVLQDDLEKFPIPTPTRTTIVSKLELKYLEVSHRNYQVIHLHGHRIDFQSCQLLLLQHEETEKRLD